jgi:hypothetical protein
VTTVGAWAAGAAARGRRALGARSAVGGRSAVLWGSTGGWAGDRRTAVWAHRRQCRPRGVERQFARGLRSRPVAGRVETATRAPTWHGRLGALGHGSWTGKPRPTGRSGGALVTVQALDRGNPAADLGVFRRCTGDRPAGHGNIRGRRGRPGPVPVSQSAGPAIRGRLGGQAVPGVQSGWNRQIPPPCCPPRSGRSAGAGREGGGRGRRRGAGGVVGGRGAGGVRAGGRRRRAGGRGDPVRRVRPDDVGVGLGLPVGGRRAGRRR